MVGERLEINVFYGLEPGCLMAVGRGSSSNSILVNARFNLILTAPIILTNFNFHFCGRLYMSISWVIA